MYEYPRLLRCLLDTILLLLLSFIALISCQFCTHACRSSERSCSCRCMVPRGLISGLGAKDAALHAAPEFTLRGVVHLDETFTSFPNWALKMTKSGKWALVLETGTDANDGVKAGIHYLMLLNTTLTSISTA